MTETTGPYGVTDERAKRDAYVRLPMLKFVLEIRAQKLIVVAPAGTSPRVDPL